MTRTTRWLIQLAQDLRYAVRQLRHAPGFTLSILLVLGLGIGANAAIFGVLNATLLRRLPFDRPEQLVSLRPVDAKGNRAWSSFPDIPAWQQQSRTLAAIAYYDAGSAYLDIPGGQELVSVTKASANLFATLGVAPALGRSFTEQEQQPGKGDVVVLSDAVWRSQFHADPAILGRTVPVDGAPATVIGVMPRNFAFPVGDTKAQIWRPRAMTPLLVCARALQPLRRRLTSARCSGACGHSIRAGQCWPRAPSRWHLTGTRSITRTAPRCLRFWLRWD
jgi:hypothetical protein